VSDKIVYCGAYVAAQYADSLCLFAMLVRVSSPWPWQCRSAATCNARHSWPRHMQQMLKGHFKSVD